MMLLCFSGFLWYDEAANLRLGDIVFRESFTKLFIKKSKADQFCECSWVFIAKVNSDICPKKMVKRYIEEASLENSEEYLYRVMT